MTDKLTVYNGALLKLGAPPLLALTDNVSSRRAFDAVYTACVTFCLELADWPFARRSVSITASTDTEPSFGFYNAFEIPDDFVLLSAMSSVATLDDPLQEYTKEGDLWYANANPLYLTYVSSGPDYGNNLGAWPEAFADLVEFRLAIKAGKHITQSDNDIELLKRDFKTARSHAIGMFGRQLPSRAFPAGAWTRARQGTRGSLRGRNA